MYARPLREILSMDQLAKFRSQLTNHADAAFLAPQLLEQVGVLSAELRAAVCRLEAAADALGEIDGQLAGKPSPTGEWCPECHDRALRATLHRLRSALDAD